MSLTRLLRKATKKIKGLSTKQRNVLCLVAALLLVAVLMLGRYLDSAPGSAGELDGETLPVETIQVTGSET